MNIKRKASHIGVYGMSGTGKTSYTERYIIGSHHPRVFIFDGESEFQDRLNLIPSYDMETFFGRAKNERILCFDPSINFEGKYEEAFDLFCVNVFEVSKRFLSPQDCDCLFVVDELQKIIGTHSILQPLKTIMQTGRRYNLDTVIMSQAPNEIHNTIRTQHTELAIFKLVDENAQKFISKIGMNADEVMRLKSLHYIWRNCYTMEERRGSIDHAK